MNGDRVKQIEYSSLIIGSKHIPVCNIITRRTNNVISSKTFHRKNQFPSTSKSRRNRIRSKNQRPDIFLQGEHLANYQQITFKGELDAKFIESYKEKLRKNLLLSRTQKGKNQCQIEMIGNDKNIEKMNQKNHEKNYSSFEQSRKQDIIQNQNTIFLSNKVISSNKFRRSSLNNIDRYGNAVKQQNITLNKISSCSKRPIVKRSDTQYTETRRYTMQDKESDSKIVINQLTATDLQFKKKQLFYINQKDMVGIRSQSFIIVQYPSGQCVTGFYYKKVLEIASLTKIMTFYAILKILEGNLYDIDKQLVIIDGLVSQISGTSAELYEGDIYSIRQLLYGLMLPSGNDAALALAKWGGNLVKSQKQENSTVKHFVNYMNKLALQTGMKSSTFGNPHGLPNPQNGSTSQDVSLLICKCLEYPLFTQVIKTKMFRCWIQNNGVKRQVVWQNTNKLLRRQGFQGVKTGVTTIAGPCLASLYKASDRTFIIVLLKTNKLSRRFKQTRYLMSMVLKRLNFNLYRDQIRKLLTNDVQLDSDNSEQQNEFNFQRNDAFQMERRVKILQYQL